MAGTVHEDGFGAMPDGSAVRAITLANGPLAVRILTLGATIQSLTAPDRDGRLAEVTLGHASLAEYLARRQFLGATVGRYANRIAGGRFTLDGRVHAVPANDGAHALHGGPGGFDRANWHILACSATPDPMVELGLDSPDGDQGFPGRLTVTARFTLGADGRLHIAYGAVTDAPTIVGLSSHCYWNLAGEGGAEDAMGHLLTIPADHYLPTDAEAIPTGDIAPVAGTPFDFRSPVAVGARVRVDHPQIGVGLGYDHCMVLGEGVAADVRPVARLMHPGSGRTLDILSDQPGLQFYSGNRLDGRSRGRGGTLHRMGDGIALEPQPFPDTPNRPAFGSVRLDPGQTYRNRIEYRLSVTG
jgi:aldose 1-epimerase